MKWLWVSLGGMLGANARLAVNLWIANRSNREFPLGIFCINISGSFLLGLLITVAARLKWNPNVSLLLGVGVLGAYTTFSTFEYDNFRLLSEGKVRLALLNIFGSVFIGLLGVAVGVGLGNFLTRHTV